MTWLRSWTTQARSGAENEALGRWTISLGSHASAACFSATFPVLPRDLVARR